MRERRWLKYNVEALLQAMGMRNTKAAVTNPSCSLFQGQPENLLVTTLHVWDKPLVGLITGSAGHAWVGAT